MSYYYEDNRSNRRPSDAEERDRRGDRPRSHSREADSAQPSNVPYSYSNYGQLAAPPMVGGSSPRLSSRDDITLSSSRPPDSYVQTGRRSHTTNVIPTYNLEQQSESIPSRDAQSQPRRVRIRDGQETTQRPLFEDDPMSRRSFSTPSSYTPHFQPPHPSYPSNVVRPSDITGETETVQMSTRTERQRYHLPPGVRDSSRAYGPEDVAARMSTLNIAEERDSQRYNASYNPSRTYSTSSSSSYASSSYADDRSQYQGIPEELLDDLDGLLENLPELNLTDQIRVDYSYPVAQGGIGDVFKGELFDHRVVAVKRPRGHLQLRPKYVKRAAREISIWATLEHKNVLRLVGYKIENSVLPSLVTDYMKYGTVNTFLKYQPRVHAYFMMIGIAEGMKYIHSKKVVHSDIKGDNILVSDLGVPLIADYGSARLAGYNPATDLMGTARWMSKELLKETKFTLESDIWAVGITFYEMLAKRLPYDHLGNDANVLTYILQDDGRPLWPPGFDQLGNFEYEMKALCQATWHDQPRKRPSASKIADMIQDAAGPLEYCSLIPPGDLHGPPQANSFSTLFDLKEFFDSSVKPKMKPEEIASLMTVPNLQPETIIASMNIPLTIDSWLRWHLRQATRDLESLYKKLSQKQCSVSSCPTCILADRPSYSSGATRRCSSDAITCSRVLLDNLVSLILNGGGLPPQEALEAIIKGIDCLFTHVSQNHRSVLDSAEKESSPFSRFKFLVNKYKPAIRLGDGFRPRLLLDIHVGPERY